MVIQSEKRKQQKREAQKRYKASKKGQITQQKYYKSEAKRKSSKKWRDKKSNDIKIKAHKLVDKAIKLGFLKRLPCEKCGVDNAFAHHDDYESPLVVRWLCNFHHSEFHKQSGGGQS